MPWVTIREAAEALKVSRRTIRRMIKAGSLPSRLDNGVRMVLLKEDQEAAADRAGPDYDQGLLTVLFDVYESLLALKDECQEVSVREKTIGGLISNLPGQEGRASLEEWLSLYQRIEACYRTIDGLIQRLALDPNHLQQVYRAMLEIRKTWTAYAQWDGGCTLSPEEGQEPTSDQKAEAMMDGIIGNLRKLLIGCARVVIPYDKPSDKAYDKGCDMAYDMPSDASCDTPNKPHRSKQ